MNLNSGVSELPLIGAYYENKLEKLGITKIEDLIHHVPSRYIDFSIISPIAKTQIGDILTVKGEVKSIKNQYTRSARKIQTAEVADSTGQITAIWFNQPYLARLLNEGDKISLSGKVDWFGKSKALISPEYEKIIPGKDLLHTGRIVPIYPETSGLSSKWLRGRIKEALFNVSNELDEFLPKEILAKYKLTDWQNALTYIHFPKSLSEAEEGRKRLAFNELLYFQIQGLLKKADWQKNNTLKKLTIDEHLIEKFKKALPFSLTQSQEKAVKEIINDLKKDYPMNRLLEGDVGSGKTVVAALAAFDSFVNGFQSVFMAPTQILARQHFETLTKIFSPFKARVALVTSEMIEKDLGRADIFVGTHALIHNKAAFENVALVVIDEQHKFGVKQRELLINLSGKKKKAPHVLTLTATPIPRTVALTFYGDLDLSALTELPPGRLPVTTWVVPPVKREKAYGWIAEKIRKEKAQAFVVCPLIEESNKETLTDVKSATKEYENLKKIFPNLSLGLIHGRLSEEAKKKVIKDFKEGKTSILVATPVVEVGIDIPNATIMVVEAAERFGLASLHQLRGRVGRSGIKSYCLLFSENKSEKVLTRLNAMQQKLSGFELAELDLKLRGPGEIFGLRQHGFPELKIASWLDFDLIKETREVAIKVTENKDKYAKLFAKFTKMHFSVD